MKTVTVLMSAYNGEKYLSQQIDSILAQKDVKVRLIIRDDGSADHTREVLEGYRDTNENVSVIFGENIGWRNSFSELVLAAGDSEYYAFADQDDFWMDDKLSTAVRALEGHEDAPCLYRGRSEIADGELKRSGKVFSDYPVLSYKRSLFQNYCQGCTLVFNRALRERYLISPLKNVSHDVWIPLLALHTGTIIDDPVPHMLYRVHNANASAGKSFSQTVKKRISVIKKQSDSLYHYNYGEVLFEKYLPYLKPESVEICRKMKEYRRSFKVKMSLFFDREVRGTTFSRTLLVKYFILTNSYRSDL